MTTPQEVGLLSAQELDALKAEYGEVSHLKLKVSDEENSHFYLKKYTRHHVEAAMKTQSREGTQAGGRSLLDSLFIAGDKRVLSEDAKDVDIRISASLLTSTTVNFLEGEVIKN